MTRDCQQLGKYEQRLEILKHFKTNNASMHNML